MGEFWGIQIFCMEYCVLCTVYRLIWLVLFVLFSGESPHLEDFLSFFPFFLFFYFILFFHFLFYHAIYTLN